MSEYAQISIRVFAAYSRVSVTYPRMPLVTSAIEIGGGDVGVGGVGGVGGEWLLATAATAEAEAGTVAR